LFCPKFVLSFATIFECSTADPSDNPAIANLPINGVTLDKSYDDAVIVGRKVIRETITVDDVYSVSHARPSGPD
jgi:hypothetical protein